MSWYVMQCRPGQEETLIRSCRSRLSPDVLQDVFLFRCERLWRAGGGNWKRIVKSMFPGYIFLQSDRPKALSRELVQYRSFANVLEEPGYLISLYADEEESLRSLCGASRCLSLSYGYRENGVNYILEGPLKGQEERIIQADWHRRFAKIELPIARRKTVVWAGLGLPGDKEGNIIKQRGMEKNLDMDKDRIENSEREICVCCGRQTDVLKKTPVSERRFYIEGGGQLCRSCYYELYGPNR